ncbi:LiaF transmembrane domain-containing protein [Pedobacter aquatilis]|uniref:LiaF transmembrane domain-containing protein n=1 Tax=Pedobacter aquatilis TaxID=351343 RepID=UPI002930201A|nr:LiaF domain-containing protein [Pedobacter aquatilis]
MENSNNINNNYSGRMLSGLIIILVGLGFLVRTMDLDIPRWIFSGSNLLILLGVFIGLRNNFKGIGWLVLVLIGAYSTIDNMHLGFDASKYALGVGLVIVGSYLIFKPKNGKTTFGFGNRQIESLEPRDKSYDKKMDNDFIEATAVFGGSHQTVFSKNFKGGDVSAVFGGADINLTQADFNETVKLDVTAVFGGIKLIVPQNWAVRSNVTALFGSVEDKRGSLMPNSEIQKTLILDGTAMFGGIEIKSF